jgi:hypothetical protein
MAQRGMVIIIVVVVTTATFSSLNLICVYEVYVAF